MNTNQYAPLVSVIIPTHDRPEMLMRAVRSVATQTFQNIEIVIVNDSSKYINQELLKKGFDIQTLKIIRNARKPGAAGERNTGFSESIGEFVGFLDDDDEWMTKKSRSKLRASEIVMIMLALYLSTISF